MGLKHYFKKHERMCVLVVCILFGISAAPIGILSGLVLGVLFSWISDWAVYIAIFLGVAVGILIPYIIWRKYGKEEHAQSPEYLHAIPDKNIAPWQVEVLVEGGLGKNGMASILLELDLTKIMVCIESEEGDNEGQKILIFKLSKDFSSAKVSSLARKLAVRMIFYKKRETSTHYICEYPYSSAAEKAFIKDFSKDHEISDFAHQTRDYTGAKVLTSILAVMTIAVIGLGLQEILLFVCLPPLLLTLIFINYYARDVFSRYTAEYHQQYLEWLSFKRMLVDYAKIEGCDKRDKAQWKEWLLYATALGVAENVNKSYPELKILTTRFNLV